ncbi:MAG: protein-L-isoaspartate O-methyltransferase [Phycisphaerae bacterium]|nr:MAG: protein-L-isoaspartate O-methyltransferase [Phycisphaerae bacterium]
MIKDQIAARGVRDKRILDAMLKVPRELFVTKECQAEAYEDKALPVGPGQTISQPYIVGYMTQMLMLEPTHRVLEIGTGTGYQTAILAQLVHRVYSVELDAGLTHLAEERLATLGLDRGVEFRSGDGVEAWRGAGPFDRILVTAGSQTLPEPLMGQLKCGGLMIIPVGRGKTQRMLRIRVRNGIWIEQPLIACRFVPLV